MTTGETPMTAWTLLGDERYYAYSRSLYRGAATSAKQSPLSKPERLRLLDACEYAVQRLAENPEAARCVARWLYREIGSSYALEDKPILSATLQRTITVVVELVKEAQREQVRLCSALTRGGTPCQRQARPESEFCPSHRHLDFAVEPSTA
jgi:hypothetical protein